MSRAHANLTAGSKLTPDTLDALYAIRASQVRLKDDVSMEQDRARFYDTMRQSTHVCVLTARGREVGFVTADLRHVHDPFDAWVMRFLYAFIEPAYRGGRAYTRAFLRDIVGQLARRPRSSLYYYGVAFPPSFVRTSTYAAEMVTLDGPSEDPHVALLEHLTRTHEGDRWSPERGAVWMPTIPSALDRAWSRPADRDAAARYELLNPMWRQGFSLPILVHVGLRTLLTTLRHTAPTLGVGSRRPR